MNNERIKQAFIVLSGKAIAKAVPELHASVITLLLRPENEIPIFDRCEGFVTMWRENKGWSEPEYWSAVFQALFTLHFGEAASMMEQLTDEREWHDGQTRYQMFPVAITGMLAAANWGFNNGERNSHFQAKLPAGLGNMIAEYARCSPGAGGMAPAPVCQQFAAELNTYLGKSPVPRNERVLREFAAALQKTTEVPEPTEPFISEVLGRLQRKLTLAEQIQSVCGAVENKYQPPAEAA